MPLTASFRPVPREPSYFNGCVPLPKFWRPMAYSKGCESFLIYTGLSANGCALLHCTVDEQVFCCHNFYHHT